MKSLIIKVFSYYISRGSAHGGFFPFGPRTVEDVNSVGEYAANSVSHKTILSGTFERLNKIKITNDLLKSVKAYWKFLRVTAYIDAISAFYVDIRTKKRI